MGKMDEMEGREACLGRVHDLALDALHTEGAHHKQWYLEKILDNVVEELVLGKGEKDWDEGIAP